MSFRFPLGNSSTAPRTDTRTRIAEGSPMGTSTRQKRFDHIMAQLHASEEMAFLQPLVERLTNYSRSTSERPFVTLSYSQSLDGSIAISRSTPYSLSCRKSLEMTHRVRSCHDALLVGIN